MTGSGAGAAVDGSGLTGRVRAAFAPAPPLRLGVAVSGGSDSVALLTLLADWAHEGGPEVEAITVDHRLRPESAAEAAAVAALCARLAVPHSVAVWTWNGQGNLADAARRGRLGCIADWAAGRGIGDVALGHTLDDQAETVLMRLARGSGVDGLSGMAVRRREGALAWWRPMLGIARAELRGLLSGRGIGWSDDPSNDDPAHDRVLARRLLDGLRPLGLSPQRLAQTAEWMRLARPVLDGAAADLARRAVRVEHGEVAIDRAPFADAHRETRLRLLSGILRWLGGRDFRPRLAPLAEAEAAVAAGGRRTLAGHILDGRSRSVIRIAREPAAVGGPVTVGQTWDGRWRVEGPDRPGLRVAALGARGLARCPDWRHCGLARRVLEVSPAVWDGDLLVAAPLAAPGGLWRAVAACDAEDLIDALIAH